jgi:hypothetical protein
MFSYRDFKANLLASAAMDATDLIAAVPRELEKHRWNYFVHNPIAMADGGKGVVVPGCPTCFKRLNTSSRLTDHICRDAVPG